MRHRSLKSEFDRDQHVCCSANSVKRFGFTYFWLFFIHGITRFYHYCIYNSVSIGAQWRCTVLNRSASNSAACLAFRSILQKNICDIEQAGTFKRERIIQSPQETSIRVAGSEGAILNFCANNYLGLAVSYIYSYDIFIYYFGFP